ncbi:MAG: hypothetical protein Q4G05_01385 [Clostridia bacterium]|nr:hypothetical protein [Clostridia bacterium]
MGQYLACGFAKKIYIKLEYQNKKEDVLKKMKKEFDLSIYDYSEKGDYLIFEMKKDLFEKYAIDFIKEQLKDTFYKKHNKMYERSKEHYERFLKLEGKSYDELMEIFEEKNNVYFQLLEGSRVCNLINYITDEYYTFADIVTFCSDGKIFMEEQNEIFYYLRKKIIKSSKSPIKTSAVVSIIG